MVKFTHVQVRIRWLFQEKRFFWVRDLCLVVWRFLLDILKLFSCQSNLWIFRKILLVCKSCTWNKFLCWSERRSRCLSCWRRKVFRKYPVRRPLRKNFPWKALSPELCQPNLPRMRKTDRFCWKSGRRLLLCLTSWDRSWHKFNSWLSMESFERVLEWWLLLMFWFLWRGEDFNLYLFQIIEHELCCKLLIFYRKPENFCLRSNSPSNWNLRG